MTCSLSYVIFSIYFSNNVLDKFVRDSILTILITLTAIYVPALAVILSKLAEMKQNYPQFRPVRILAELKVFINEVVVYIGISLLIILLSPEYKPDFNLLFLWFYFCSAILLTVLLLSIRGLWDISNTIVTLYSATLLE